MATFWQRSSLCTSFLRTGWAHLHRAHKAKMEFRQHIAFFSWLRFVSSSASARSTTNSVTKSYIFIDPRSLNSIQNCPFGSTLSCSLSLQVQTFGTSTSKPLYPCNRLYLTTWPGGTGAQATSYICILRNFEQRRLYGTIISYLHKITCFDRMVVKPKSNCRVWLVTTTESTALSKFPLAFEGYLSTTV